MVRRPELCIQLARPFGEAAQSRLYLQFTLNEDACLKAFQGRDLFPRKLIPVCHSSDYQESFPANAWSASFLLHLCLLVLRLGEQVISFFSVEALFTWSLFHASSTVKQRPCKLLLQFLFFQSSALLCCSCPAFLQTLRIFSDVQCPKLDHVFPLRPSQCWVEGIIQDLFPLVYPRIISMTQLAHLTTPSVIHQSSSLCFSANFLKIVPHYGLMLLIIPA